MPDYILQELQKSADSALKAESVQEGVHHLSRAFLLFSEEASRLKIAYSKLQESFQSVNQELSSKVAELGRLNSYLTNILKNISDAILFIELGGTVTMINEAAAKLLQIKPETVLFKRYWDVFPDDYFGFPMRESLKFGICHKLLYKSYPQREVEISTTFVYDGPKLYHGLILVLRDVSEKQKLQLVANRNDRMKELGEMAAVVAHEIRNPLGGIRGFASLLYRDLEENKPLQEMASYVIEGTKRLEKLVSAILQYARPIQIQPQSVELGAYLKSIGKFVKIDTAFPENVKMEIHTPQDPLIAPIDPEALKSALLNLIFNALQAMETGGNLSISLIKMGELCQIAISDTGIGMEKELQDRLFSPFFTTKKKGNGLGLVETQKIVQAHLGTIDVRSCFGKGTTFTIHLPLKR